jgi:hypothetical protein
MNKFLLVGLQSASILKGLRPAVIWRSIQTKPQVQAFIFVEIMLHPDGLSLIGTLCDVPVSGIRSILGKQLLDMMVWLPAPLSLSVAIRHLLDGLRSPLKQDVPLSVLWNILVRS